MLEEKIDALTVAIEKLIAELQSDNAPAKKANGKAAAKSDAPAKQDNVETLKPATKKPASKAKAAPEPEPSETEITKDDVREVLKDVVAQSDDGHDAALVIMKEHADGAVKMSQIEEKHYQAIYDACQMILEKKAA